MAARSRRFLPLVLALALGACTMWGRQPLPQPGQDRFLVGPVYVTRADGSTVLLDNVTLTADSVVGHERAGTHARVAIAAGDVRRVESQRTDALSTAATALVALLAAFAGFAALTIATMGTGS